MNLSTRRMFLRRGLALLAAAPTVPSFLDQTLMAMTLAMPSRTAPTTGKDGRILVVVQLAGGNDGLNMVAPWADDAYHRSRPRIAVGAKEALRIDDHVGLHPNLSALKGLYDDGRMAIVQGVGYPNPNRSHFRSGDIWESAQPENERPTSGWIGRYFDNNCPGADPMVGLTIGDTLPLAMRGERVTPLNFDRPESFRYRGPDAGMFRRLNGIDEGGAIATGGGATNGATGGSAGGAANDAAGGDGKVNGATNGRGAGGTSARVNADGAAGGSTALAAGGNLDFLHRTAMDAQVGSDRILGAVGAFRPSGNYPRGSFGDGLKTVAALIAAGMPTRVYYVTLGGFDTHADERGRHDGLMKQLDDGLGAFWTDLRAQKNDDRVMLMTFSEFGRRVEQNASGGTDHGAAAPMLILGGTQKGLVGKHPSLTDLDHGDLKFGIDFRTVYGKATGEWLG